MFMVSMDEWAMRRKYRTGQQSDIIYICHDKCILWSSELTVPENQRNFATKDNLPNILKNSCTQKKELQVMIFGIGRACHIAFWEPHFAADYASEEEWLAATIAWGKSTSLTIEQKCNYQFPQ